MNKYLLDTHVIIWMLEDDQNISLKAKDIIQNPQNTCFLSLISLQEIAIKKNIGKLEFNISLNVIVNELKLIGIKLLNIEPEHLIELINLKIVHNHKDPFDRMIISTAISENLTIISIDEKFSNYKDLVEINW